MVSTRCECPSGISCKLPDWLVVCLMMVCFLETATHILSIVWLPCNVKSLLAPGETIAVFQAELTQAMRAVKCKAHMEYCAEYAQHDTASPKQSICSQLALQHANGVTPTCCISSCWCCCRSKCCIRTCNTVSV